MKVIIITTHEYYIGRKTGLHFLSEYFSKKNKTYFITVGLSYLSFLKKHRKHFSKPFNKLRQISSNLYTYTWVSFFHPFKTPSRFIDTLIEPIVSLYALLLPKTLKLILKDNNEKYFVIIENGSGLLLVNKIKLYCKNVKLIYWQSDKLSLLPYPNIIHKAEKKFLYLFDYVRTNAMLTAEEYKLRHPKVFYIQQGIQKNLFNQKYSNPYKKKNNVISMGESHLDKETLIKIIEMFPNWNFHIFGKNIRLPKYPHLTHYGEINFNQLVPYIIYADIGLAIYNDHESTSYLVDSSLKIIQYSYCRLPVICPNIIKNPKKNIFTYRTNDQKSIYNSFMKAISFNKNDVSNDEILDWSEIGKKILLLNNDH